MSRIIKNPEVRKAEILDSAQRFFFMKGYEETTIQEIIDDLNIAKGTFYYYFKSKIELLDELIEKISTEMASRLYSIVESEMNAVDKFNLLFQKGTAFEMENIDVFIVFLEVLFREENAIIRDKMYRRMIEKNTPFFIKVIKQGIEEGIFDTEYPEDVGEMMMQIGRNLNESLCRLFLNEDVSSKTILSTVQRKMRVYEYSLERVLNAPRGSLRILPPESERIVRMVIKKLRPGNRGSKNG
jgi:AcrR family transcriptional regulator